MAESEDEFQEDRVVNTSIGRRTYLVTYAQADMLKFPTRQSFGEMIQRHFDSGTSKVKTEYWACCKEQHKDSGEHYHLSLKLNGVKKWSAVKDNINKDEDIVVHFSNKPSYYIASYKYVTKEDQDVYHSPGHPNLKDVSSPTTKKCTLAYRKKRRSMKELTDVCEGSATTTNDDSSLSSRTPTKTGYKVKRLTNLEVSDFIAGNRISNSTELFAVANSRKVDGQRDLANFVLSRSTKVLEELITNTYRMVNSAGELERQKTTRLELLKEKSLIECVPTCEKVWLTSAIEVLQFNKIHPVIFATSVRDLLIKGRGKWRNIMITGERNCAKTFILKPLELIYKCFQNPSKDKYAWVGADEAEVILLQDFRWDSETIAWKCMLLLLEGEHVKLPAPKNHFSKDVTITSDIPIFATSKEAIKYKGPNNSSDEIEDKMMDCRWKVFNFKHEFRQDDQKTMSPCARCFAELILMGIDGV